MRARFAAFSYLSEANGSFIVKAHRVRRLTTGASATAEKAQGGAVVGGGESGVALDAASSAVIDPMERTQSRLCGFCGASRKRAPA